MATKYYVDASGSVLEAKTPQDAEWADKQGTLSPASPDEVRRYYEKKRDKERYEISKGQYPVSQGLMAFLEGAGSAIPFYPLLGQYTGGSTTGEQKLRAEEYPISHYSGVATGLVGSLGLGPLLKGVSVASKAGVASKGLQAMLAGDVLVGDALAGGAARVLTKAAPTAMKSGAAQAAAGFATGVLRAAPVVAKAEVNESLLEHRDISGEAVLWGSLLGGGIEALTTGAPTAAKALAKTKWGRTIAQKTAKAQAEQTLAAFDPSGSELRRATQQIGKERYFDIINKMHERGVFGLGKSPDTVLLRSREGLDKAGKDIGAILAEAELREPSASSVDLDRLLEKMSDDIVLPLSKSASKIDKDGAKHVTELIQQLRSDYPNGLTLRDLSDIRTQISRDIYGLAGTKDPMRSGEIEALGDVRHMLTERLKKGFEDASIPESVWKAAQEDYELYSRASQLAAKASVAKAAAGNRSVTEIVADAISVAKHGVKGAFFSTAYKGTKKALSGGYEWAINAANRAAESGASPEVVADLDALARSQVNALANKIIIKLSPQEATSARFLKHYSDLSALSEQMSRQPSRYSEEAIAAVNDATDILNKTYGKNLAAEDAAAAIKAAQDRLSAASRFGPMTDKARFKASAERLRPLRDEMAQSLSDASLWGAEIARRAEDEALRMTSNRVDADRVNALRALQDSVNLARTKSATKAESVMGAKPGSIVVPRIKQELQDAAESARARMQENQNQQGLDLEIKLQPETDKPAADAEEDSGDLFLPGFNGE